MFLLTQLPLILLPLINEEIPKSGFLKKPGFFKDYWKLQQFFMLHHLDNMKSLNVCYWWLFWRWRPFPESPFPCQYSHECSVGRKKNQRKFSNSTVFKAQLIDYNRAINVKYRRSPNLTQGYFHDGLVWTEQKLCIRPIEIVLPVHHFNQVRSSGNYI